MALLNINDLSLGYESQVILSHLNFVVNAKDYLCIVGENGSGKTTLLRTLVNLQKPLGGEILFGENLKQYEIGYLPQQTIVQKDFPASVEEIVLSGCQNKMGRKSFYQVEEKKKAEESMEKMNILSLRKKCYRELSGGQQQRVLLARALCATTKLLLLDEPVAGLDPTATEDMYHLIDELNKEGITIIMISHDLSSAMKYASHVLSIGENIFFGTKEDYLKNINQYIHKEETQC